jgi:hypothetical protein
VATNGRSEQLNAIADRLARIDTASSAPWTACYLGLIAAQPGVVSLTLARQAGVGVLPFKRRVRQLKELGSPRASRSAFACPREARALLERLPRDPG